MKNKECIFKKINDNNSEEIESFLKAEDKSLPVPLSERVNLHSFCKKIVENAEIYACNSDGKIVGMIVFYANDSVDGIAYLTYLCVTKEYREKGVGFRLIEEMKKVCQKQGMKKIRLRTNKENYKAQHFYEKLGFLKIEDEPEEYLFELMI